MADRERIYLFDTTLRCPSARRSAAHEDGQPEYRRRADEGMNHG